MKKIGIYVVLLLLLFHPTTAHAAQEQFSGTRKIVLSVDVSNLLLYINGGRQALNLYMGMKTPEWLQVDMDGKNRDVYVTFSFSFESKDEYVQKMSYLTSMENFEILYQEPDGEKEGYYWESLPGDKVMELYLEPMREKELILWDDFYDFIVVRENEIVLNSVKHSGFYLDGRINTWTYELDIPKYRKISIATEFQKDTLSRTIEVYISVADFSEEWYQELVNSCDANQMIVTRKTIANMEVAKIEFSAESFSELGEKTMMAVRLPHEIEVSKGTDSEGKTLYEITEQMFQYNSEDDATVIEYEVNFSKEYTDTYLLGSDGIRDDSIGQSFETYDKRKIIFGFINPGKEEPKGEVNNKEDTGSSEFPEEDRGENTETPEKIMPEGKKENSERNPKTESEEGIVEENKKEDIPRWLSVELDTTYGESFGKIKRILRMKANKDEIAPYHDSLMNDFEQRMKAGVSLYAYDEGDIRCYEFSYESYHGNKIASFTEDLTGFSVEQEHSGSWLPAGKGHVSEKIRISEIVDYVEMPEEVVMKYSFPKEFFVEEAKADNENKEERSIILCTDKTIKLDVSYQEALSWRVLCFLTGTVCLVFVIGIVVCEIIKIQKKKKGAEERELL